MTAPNQLVLPAGVGRYLRRLYGPNLSKLVDALLVLALGTDVDRQIFFREPVPAKPGEQRECLDFARPYFASPEYRQSIVARKYAGRLVPVVEHLIQQYYASYLLDADVGGCSRQ